MGRVYCQDEWCRDVELHVQKTAAVLLPEVLLPEVICTVMTVVSG